MGKKERVETDEERRARKRSKKEAKKVASEAGRDFSGAENEVEAACTPSPAKAITASDKVKAGTKDSSFERKRLKMVVSLYPVALGDVLSNVRDALNSLLLKYSDGIGGVLLAFDNVKLVADKGAGSGHGVILNELPHIHYLVELDALVFCPVVGKKLTGVVNECFPSHVGVLLHKFFNAMISSDHMHSAGYVFDRELQQWMEEDGTKIVGNEDQVDFVIDNIHECAGVISIEGSQPSVS